MKMENLKFTKIMLKIQALVIIAMFICVGIASDTSQDVALYLLMSLPFIWVITVILGTAEEVYHNHCSKNPDGSRHEFTDWYHKEDDNKEWEQKHCIHCRKIVTRDVPHYAELEK